jgi:hypothetical protein
VIDLRDIRESSVIPFIATNGPRKAVPEMAAAATFLQRWCESSVSADVDRGSVAARMIQGHPST